MKQTGALNVTPNSAKKAQKRGSRYKKLCCFASECGGCQFKRAYKLAPHRLNQKNRPNFNFSLVFGNFFTPKTARYTLNPTGIALFLGKKLPRKARGGGYQFKFNPSAGDAGGVAIGGAGSAHSGLTPATDGDAPMLADGQEGWQTEGRGLPIPACGRRTQQYLNNLHLDSAKVGCKDAKQAHPSTFGTVLGTVARDMCAGY